MHKSDENRVATVGDVKKIVTEMAEVILNGIGELLKNYATKDDLQKMEAKLDRRFDKLETDVTYIRRDIIDLKADLSSNADVESLKARVTKLEQH